ncbi:MAG: chromosome segregation protein SMC [Alphaproteobacteria bacterium]|nr:MAG: chromosome segregation protein SMC [Alphaproteobacteria bacterium]
MIQFASLRLSGFKSFVDKTELEIGPGLNGIVGPNGCGKSNLVEALRWVMGESSAKRMRGSGMEDVIFAGTDRRSARNFAEVSLLLNNTSRTAPTAYNNNDDIEVIRKIERDKGSGYKINGRHARARDVQMLFADTVTGSNSPSLVSQGHVTRMINAKPQDRRLILEESAGIAGLYARRHEAELRLKATDTNLIRVDDILGSMETRLNALKRQARQASKYKNLSAQIRQFELIITYLEWQKIISKQKEITKAFSAAESIVAENLGTVTQLTKTQNTQIEELPALRKTETALSAKLQKHKLDFERLESEAERHLNDLQETKAQMHQTNIDAQHEEKTLEESSTLLERTEVEHKDLLEEQSNDSQTQQTYLKTKDDLKVTVIELEERFTALKENAAESRAREESLNSQIKRHNTQLTTLSHRKGRAQTEMDLLVIDEDSRKKITLLEEKTATLEEELHDLKGKTDKARQDISEADQETETARNALSEIEKKHAEFIAEISVLEQFFQNDEAQNFPPILDSIITEPGFEKALSRALGDSLMASVDDDAPTNWRTFDHNIKLDTLPSGALPLLPHIDAPKELHVTLSQIGFVADQETGARIYSSLKAGQSLVSADGYYWRWDGYHVQSHATDRHSVHLEQKNKLLELEKHRGKIQESLESLQATFNDALSKQNTAKQSYDSLLSDIKTTERTLKDLRPALQKIKDKNLRVESEKKRYEDQIKSIDEDVLSMQETLQKDKISLDAIIQSQDNGTHSEDIIEQLKETLDQAKEEHQNAVREYDMLSQEQNTRRARIQAIADERISLKNRTIRATEHLKTLKGRIQTLTEKLTSLNNQPINLENGHEEMLTLISKIEAQKADAADQLCRCEEDVATTNKALKEAETTLGNAREERAGNQAMLAAANEQLKALETTIEEKLDIRPQDLLNHAAVDLVKYQTDDLPKLKQDKDQLNRQRDAIGPVNLRAEDESNSLEKEFTTLLHEKNDLIQAIEELRGAINKINKEARERLNIAFDHVNAHFQRLFVRLFDGGKAHLKLVASEDPLGAGLEIFAQPPGKALQSLSLLSGGEQTLTSIALIFAMFLTNPSPICVLDEIDAPLDDANVDRVCNLLDEIAARGETRFLVITHHRLSMARMDRLYGVTMSEKGVSQLVSVDLQQSFGFVDKQVA